MNRNKVYLHKLIQQINHLTLLKINRDLESKGLTTSQARVLYYLYRGTAEIRLKTGYRIIFISNYRFKIKFD